MSGWRNDPKIARRLKTLRWSLAFVWIASAAVSIIGLDDRSLDLLHQAGLRDTDWNRLLIMGGALLDALLGVALLIRPSPTVYKASLALMLVMTIAATLLLPDLWLHPLGPLTKNLPMAILLLFLIEADNDPLSDD